MAYKKTILVLVILCSHSSFSQETGTATKQDTLPAVSYSTIPEFWNQMDDIFNDPNFSNANWGVIIQSLETGEYFYKRNEDKLFVPASNLKLFTTAAALVLLGPDYQYTTDIFISGKIDGSILEGDLVIVGYGDPTISGRFYNGDMFKVFNDWADTLIALGIDEINGNIIGDDNNFEPIGLGKGWAWNYEPYWYAAPSGAISFNDNCVEIIVSAGMNDSKAVISVQPNTKYISIINNVTVVQSDSGVGLDIHRERGTNVISVFGAIKKGSESEKIFATVNNPTQFAMVVLKEILEMKGIIIRGFPVDADDLAYDIDYSNAEKLFSYRSPHLKEIIKVINKNSHNFYAEQLLKTIGLEKEGFGSVENGVKAMQEVHKEMGINPESMLIADGSGLSAINLVTPKQILNVLHYMSRNNHYLPFINSLPIAGVDGTLGSRMKNTKAANKVRAKTGYLSNVRSLSGYAYTADNEPIAFSIIVNNFNVPVKLAENIQDLVCLRLANFRRK